jgi:hypothetical protein
VDLGEAFALRMLGRSKTAYRAFSLEIRQLVVASGLPSGFGIALWRRWPEYWLWTWRKVGGLELGPLPSFKCSRIVGNLGRVFYGLEKNR